MRRPWLLAPITLSVLLNSADCRAQAATAETSSPVILPANTSVILCLTKSLYKKDAKPGQPVEFEVAFDVVVNGQIFVQSGTPVTGRFRWLDRTGKGRAKVLIDLDPVQTVPGEMVRLAWTSPPVRSGQRLTIDDAVGAGPEFPPLIPVSVVMTLFQKKVLLDKDEGAGWFWSGGLWLVAHVTERVALDPARQKVVQEQYTAKQKNAEAERREVASKYAEYIARQNGEKDGEARPGEASELAPELSLSLRGLFSGPSKAELLRRAGDLDGAVEAYQQDLAWWPHDPGLHLQLGGLYREKGDFARAVSKCREAVKLSPNDERARIGLIDTLADAGDVDGALAEAKEALHMWPERPYFHYILGRVLVKKNDPDAAIAELQWALREHKNHLSPANCELGHAFELKGDPKAALHQYRIAVRAHGGGKECHAA